MKALCFDPHLCDVLNKVLAEGKSAAYEPHGDHMVGQRHNVLVEPDVSKTYKSESIYEAKIHVYVFEY